MAIGIEALLFLIGGIVLAVILIQVFGRRTGSARSRPESGMARVRLERKMKFPEGIDETRLLINDQPILVASGEGLRLADYADEVEQLETMATRIALALGVSVELARVPEKGGKPQEEAVPVRRLPRSQQDDTSR
jgi:hypothetical protein